MCAVVERAVVALGTEATLFRARMLPRAEVDAANRDLVAFRVEGVEGRELAKRGRRGTEVLVAAFLPRGLALAHAQHRTQRHALLGESVVREHARVGEHLNRMFVEQLAPHRFDRAPCLRELRLHPRGRFFEALAFLPIVLVDRVGRVERALPIPQPLHLVVEPRDFFLRVHERELHRTCKAVVDRFGEACACSLRQLREPREECGEDRAPSLG
jgi:hypothetical protein